MNEAQVRTLELCHPMAGGGHRAGDLRGVSAVCHRADARTTETIDHNTLARLVEESSVRGTQVVGRPDGWGVVVRYGRTRRPLAATRSGEVRVFKRLETLVGYLKGIGISHFDVDAADFNSATVTTTRRPDASKALKHAHEAAAHDKCFRAEIAKGIKEANDPATVWVSHDDARANWASKRARLVKRAKPVKRGDI